MLSDSSNSNSNKKNVIQNKEVPISSDNKKLSLKSSDEIKEAIEGGFIKIKALDRYQLINNSPSKPVFTKKIIISEHESKEFPLATYRVLVDQKKHYFGKRNIKKNTGGRAPHWEVFLIRKCDKTGLIYTKNQSGYGTNSYPSLKEIEATINDSYGFTLDRRPAFSLLCFHNNTSGGLGRGERIVDFPFDIQEYMKVFNNNVEAVMKKS